MKGESKLRTLAILSMIGFIINFGIFGIYMDIEQYSFMGSYVAAGVFFCAVMAYVTGILVERREHENFERGLDITKMRKFNERNNKN